jgi:hypothetical protein
MALAMADEAMELRSVSEAKDLAWKAVERLGLRCGSQCGKGMYMLVITAPCYGFGDIVFGKKFAQYLRSWYGATVMIATTHVSGFEKVGEPGKNLIPLEGKTTECRRFARLKPGKNLGSPDLIFVAPLQADMDPSVADVRALIPSADKFNTFFLSEYNPWAPKGFDFPTGVGAGHVGLFLSKPRGSIPRPASLKGPFALAYLAESIDSSDGCLIAFIEMVAAKHKKNKVFDVVVPPWVTNDIDYLGSKIARKVKKYFPSVHAVGKNKQVMEIANKGGNLLRLRGDILPVSHTKMMSLIRWSVPDVLLTGDQSISDAISCCPTKNIFYQIAPWKDKLGRALAKELPNKYLMSRKTSCGTLQAVSYKSSYSKFASKWSFEHLAKPKLDAVVLAARLRSTDPGVQVIESLVVGSKQLPSLQKKVDDFVENGCRY